MKTAGERKSNAEGKDKLDTRICVLTSTFVCYLKPTKK